MSHLHGGRGHKEDEEADEDEDVVARDIRVGEGEGGEPEIAGLAGGVERGSLVNAKGIVVLESSVDRIRVDCADNATPDGFV